MVNTFSMAHLADRIQHLPTARIFYAVDGLRMGAQSERINGVMKERSLLEMLDEAGFVEAEFCGWTGYHTSPLTEGAMIVAQKPSEDDA